MVRRITVVAAVLTVVILGAGLIDQVGLASAWLPLVGLALVVLAVIEPGARVLPSEAKGPDAELALLFFPIPSLGATCVSAGCDAGDLEPHSDDRAGTRVRRGPEQ